MQITSYVDLAVSLVNTAGRRRTRSDAAPAPRAGRDDDVLRTVADLRILLADDPVWRRVADEHDLELMRLLRAEIRTVFEDASVGEETAAVQRINVLLGSIQVVPRLTGHDGVPWHMHLADGASSVYAGCSAAVVLGLAFYVAEHGFGRLGVCLATSCPRVFLDTSSNRSRRYCSQRCATRSNVAAFRARRRARGAGQPA